MAHLVLDYLEKRDMQTVTHLLHSPNFSLCDRWLFPTLKHGLCSWQFPNNAEVIKVLTALLNRISEEEFQTTMLTKHRGCYFEKERDVEQDSHSNSDGIRNNVFAVTLCNTFSCSG